ncbi:hypothetical protein EC988_003155 [Linderina pennispora]|nr:hypothetical protein EC988_003155 [Linderina pennispora]
MVPVTREALGTSSCRWPTSAQKGGAEPVRVAIVADPQIVDHYSYNQTGVLLRVVEFFTDIYIKKSYIFLQMLQEPDTVIFLGDLMDGAREWNDSDWHEEYDRYKALFRNRSPGSMKVYDMAGNHDIGIGNTVVDSALERFHKYVGPTNQVLHIADHEVILLDTLTLESDLGRVNRSSRGLVERLAAAPASGPRLLFTHVPMWRPPETYCGPLRQASTKYLKNRRGYQFRDQLFQNTTEYLLESLAPSAVFSGDDHDTCTIQHPTHRGKAATEYTIGAFGWASGVPIASYGLMTLYPGDNSTGRAPEFYVTNCYLPYQLGIYKVYIASFVLSLLVVVAVCYWETRGLRQWWHFKQGSDAEYMPVRLPPPTSLDRHPRHWGMHGLVRKVGITMRDVAVVALPTYIACLAVYYIV